MHIRQFDVKNVADIRNELLVWDMESGHLVKQMGAHFQRIVDIQSLVVGTDNLVVTSSIDRSSLSSAYLTSFRCIKIWNLDHIFEKEQHIDKHNLPIDSISISTTAGISVVVTRFLGREKNDMSSSGAA